MAGSARFQHRPNFLPFRQFNFAVEIGGILLQWKIAPQPQGAVARLNSNAAGMCGEQNGCAFVKIKTRAQIKLAPRSALKTLQAADDDTARFLFRCAAVLWPEHDVLQKKFASVQRPGGLQ